MTDELTKQILDIVAATFDVPAAELSEARLHLRDDYPNEFARAVEPYFGA